MLFIRTLFISICAISMLAVPSFAQNAEKAIKRLDKNGDGQVSKSEWKKYGKPIKGFKKMDTDGNGFLSLEEFEARFGGGKGSGISQSTPKPAPQAKKVIAPQGMDGWQGPMIDVHSQVDGKTDLSSIVPMLDQAGIHKVVLSTRFKQPSIDVIALARQHPTRIIPAAKTKTKAFMKGQAGYPDDFLEELGRYDYKAMAEVIMWHAAKKGVGAGRAVIQPDDPRIKPMIKAAREGGYPYIVHVETGDMGWDKGGYVEKLEKLFAANRDIAFGMIHMAQMDMDDVTTLLPRHPNLFFITSHSNPVTIGFSKLPWTRMFDSESLKPQWKSLIEAHPDRFVLGFDNVFHFHWEGRFIPQVRVWRKALAELPDDVAHMVAHRNAERLWKIPPVQ